MNPKSSMFERILVYCFLMIPLLSISARAQTVDTIQIITGTVRDAQTSEGIPGVNVISGDRGTATDIDGKFQLEIAAGDSLTITRIGYKTIRIYPRKETLEISLEPTIIHGEDVEVVATRAVRAYHRWHFLPCPGKKSRPAIPWKMFPWFWLWNRVSTPTAKAETGPAIPTFPSVASINRGFP